MRIPVVMAAFVLQEKLAKITEEIRQMDNNGHCHWPSEPFTHRVEKKDIAVNLLCTGGI